MMFSTMMYCIMIIVVALSAVQAHFDPSAVHGAGNIHETKGSAEVELGDDSGW